MTFLRELRRLLLAATATAIASTAFLAAPTQAATVTMGSGCSSGSTYTGVTIDANGNFTIQCSGGGAGGVGTVGFSPTSYNVPVGGQVALTITRMNGSTGPVGANMTVSSGNCTLSAASVSFADADNSPKTVNVNGNGVGTCTVSMAVTGGAVAGSTTATVSVDPTNAPGTFGVSIANASVGENAVVTVQLTRTNGTTGTFDVSYTLTPTNINGATITPSPMRFNSGEGTKTVQVNTGTLASGTTGTLVVAVTGAVAVAPTTGTATFGGSATITVGTTSACPATPSNAVQLSNLGNEGQWNLVNLSNGQIGYMALPSLPAAILGATITQTQTQGSGEITKLEIGISKCPGDIMYGAPSSLGGANNQQRFGYSPCYSTSTQVSNNSLNWHLTVGTHYAFCYSPASEGPWYVNVRYTLPSCAYGQGNCGSSFQWNRR